jgi:formylmethanofuran dehydrogenase subunit E
MELTLSLQDHLHRSTLLHSHLCPRQVIGVRMGRLACRYFGIDPGLPAGRKKLFVFMEIGHCAADGVMVVTTASPTNGLMKLVDYGKVAATFVDLRTGRALRVSERQSSRATALVMFPDAASDWAAYLQGYQVMSDEELLEWEEVGLVDPGFETPGEPHKVKCEACGDAVHEHYEVVMGGHVLCKPCAYGAYYYPSAMVYALEVPEYQSK